MSTNDLQAANRYLSQDKVGVGLAAVDHPSQTNGFRALKRKAPWSVEWPAAAGAAARASRAGAGVGSGAVSAKATVSIRELENPD